MTDFKSYMEKVNVSFQFLNKFYKIEDIASIYGVDKFEIKHSNVLKWILEPKGDDAIDYMPTRNLLKIIQEKNSYYDFFNSVDLANAILNKVSIQRERYNIDILITLKINDDDYAIVIENKLESLTHDEQLDDYKRKVENIYPNHNKLHVLLSPGTDKDLIEEAVNNQYIPITYQDVYDRILKVILELTSDSTLKLIVYFYVHTLSCYESNNLIGLIVTDEEASALESLFKDTQILTMIEKLYNNVQGNEYIRYYNNNKSTFYKIFKKYSRMSNFNKELNTKLEDILKRKAYILNGVSHKSISDLIKSMFDELLNKQGKTLEEIKDLVNLFESNNPLLVLVNDVLETEHSKWYTSSKRNIEYKGNEYYILSSWYSREYDELKSRFEQLKEDKPNVYDSITLE